jgi:hypothetical protein
MQKNQTEKGVCDFLTIWVDVDENTPTHQTHQTNQTNQTNQTHEIYPINHIKQIGHKQNKGREEDFFQKK